MKSVEDIEFDADKDVEVFEPLTDIPATNVPSRSAVNFGGINIIYIYIIIIRRSI